MDKHRLGEVESRRLVVERGTEDVLEGNEINKDSTGRRIVTVSTVTTPGWSGG